MTVAAELPSEPNPAVPHRGRISLPGDLWRRRLLIGVVMTYVTVLIVAPITMLFPGAFSEGINAIGIALSNPALWAAFGLTLYIALICVLVHALFGTMLAWVLVRHRIAGRRLLNALIDLPFALSPVVVGYMLLLLFGRNGLLAPVLATLNVQVAFALPGMVLATLFITMPFMVREIIPILESFSPEQELAAASLGANTWQTFWRVTFPALRSGLIYGVVLTFARALGEFGAVLVVGGGIQGRTETATIFIFNAMDHRQYVSAYSAAIILGLFSLVLVVGTELLRRKKK